MTCIKAWFNAPYFATKYRYFSFPDEILGSEIEMTLEDLLCDYFETETVQSFIMEHNLDADEFLREMNVDYELIALSDVSASEPIIYKPTKWDYAAIG